MFEVLSLDYLATFPKPHFLGVQISACTDSRSLSTVKTPFNHFLPLVLPSNKIKIHRFRSIITLAISKCYGKVRVLFFRATTLISRGNSHVSRVRGLVVRCLLFNPEVSCSNPSVCANFFTSIPKQKVLTFFGTMRLFGFVRLFFGFVRLFFEIF